MPGNSKKKFTKCLVCQRRIFKQNRRVITVENAQKIADHFGQNVRYGEGQFICTKCRAHLTRGCSKKSQKNQPIGMKM